MCHLLGITPAPNNGTWSTVSDMLVNWNSPNGDANGAMDLNGIILTNLGVHCENHGFVGNYMYDIKHKEKFLIWRNKPTIYNTYWWEDAEPVWITAMKQGKRAYMYRWCGCEVMIEGRNATYCKKYVSLPPISELGTDIDDAIRELKSNNADLVALYAEMSDFVGHSYGPNSKEIENVIVGFDKQFQHLMTSLATEGLADDVNVIIVSDHGMAEVSPSRVINLTTDINMNDVDEILDSGSVVNIWPKQGKVDKVYQDLKRMKHPHLQVFKKQEIPERWHLKRHYRTPPIFLVADVGWYIATHPSLIHFKVNFGVRPFANVHVYQLMCHLLGIKPAPNNGTWSTVSSMLTSIY
ncbi:hypothetical protein KUTeg_020435 [Tegillarca granosa]|uniref:glycerophosphocholine cholinephosphodiesterase n=1 Tax=Tegillarca granosa TaxID=220873 RepID=A0ABQ9E7W2_TEGGR|nr:hypothetical protein KUTeg_020435 [Tegillarca granosa]